MVEKRWPVPFGHDQTLNVQSAHFKQNYKQQRIDSAACSARRDAVRARAGNNAKNELAG
jgi:hypothetical protein